MAKVEQAAEIVVKSIQQPRGVATACVELEEAVKDRRENGGAHAVVRVKTLSLIEMLVEDLEA